MPRRLSLSLKLALAFLGVSALTLAIVLFIVERSTSSSFQSYIDHQQAMSQMMKGNTMPAMGAPANTQIPITTDGRQGFFERLRLSVVLGGVGGAALALLFGVFVAGKITGPLREIEDAARAVARGDTARRARVDSGDEVGDLASSFNQMATELQRQEQTRQQFVADVAHELRTPLAVLQAEIEALQDGVTAPTTDRLASLHEETEILARLVEDLRTLSLADAGELKLNRRLEPAAEVIRRGSESMAEAAARAGLRLAVDAPADLPAIEVDGGRIAQVLMNLLSNAIRHTPEGGQVAVEATAVGGSLRVSVRDSGSGIPTEALAHVFDRFYRVDASRSRESGGSGLGLAIARQLVRAHGGEIEAQNNAGAPGATFVFTLPLAGSTAVAGSTIETGSVSALPAV